MTIANKEILEEFTRKHSNVKSSVEKWKLEVATAQWASFNDLHLKFPSADYVGEGRVVFNIKGNDYRLIAIVLYVIHLVEIRWIGTHAEYNKIKDCSLI